MLPYRDIPNVDTRVSSYLINAKVLFSIEESSMPSSTLSMVYRVYQVEIKIPRQRCK